MSSNTNPDIEADAAQIEQIQLEDQVPNQYTSYAMSVIVSRAIPDARDGLKPVQRRILYTMDEMGISSAGSHRKSSSVVGETMGDYHPHGDSSIYDTLTNMAQDFSMQVPLVDGQGNFGSLDGDPAAAKRYTEARLSPASENLLDDIDMDTTDFSPNYDNRLEEPDVLPAGFPNLLVNGTSGIAVGMATDIPPHNLRETVDATIHRIGNPDCDVTELMEHLPAPDFPTGATIIGRDGVKKAYETGDGKVRLRADYEVDRENGRIIVTEIPFHQKKSNLIQSIAEKINDGKIEGATDIRDKSDRTGVRIPIDIKASANIDIVENQLIQTALERTVTMNHIALVDGQPRRLSLPDILDEYISHRRDVIRRRSEYELQENQDELHKVRGRLTALDDIESVVETVRNSADRGDAVETLQDDYDLSEEQSKHITRMQLSSLTGLEEQNLRDQRDTLEEEISALEEILADATVLDQQVIDELEAVRQEHGRERRTTIKEEFTQVDDEDLIPEEENVFVLTENNYLKRVDVETFRVQNRNGKGVLGMRTDTDNIKKATVANSHDRFLLLTDKGNVHDLKGYEIPTGSRQAHGSSAAGIIDIDPDESIVEFVQVPADTSEKFLFIATEDANVKRTELSEFDNIYTPGIRGVTLEDGDNVAYATVTSGACELILATRDGQSIRFDETDVRATGRSARGVRGITLTGDDTVVDAACIDADDQQVLSVAASGKGKRTAVSEHRTQQRGGKGVRCISNAAAPLVALETITPADTVVIADESNNVLRTDAESISQYGRVANGVNVMDTQTQVTTACVEQNNE